MAYKRVKPTNEIYQHFSSLLGINVFLVI